MPGFVWAGIQDSFGSSSRSSAIFTYCAHEAPRVVVYAKPLANAADAPTAWIWNDCSMIIGWPVEPVGLGHGFLFVNRAPDDWLLQGCSVFFFFCFAASSFFVLQPL